MQCPQCRHENAAGQKFCGECGTRLVSVCSACQAANPPTNKFCGECGARLTADTVPPAPAALADNPHAPRAAPVTAGPPPAERFASPESYTPKHLADKILTSRGAVEGERKTVTVLFADVSGFTEMSERMDPEEVHGIMDRAFEVILDAVHFYEGTVNQFLGDGVMALFGAPIAHEDHAHRALKAALTINEGLRPLAAEIARTRGLEFRMRMGVNTGPVVVGAIGKDLRMDYTAVGDTTNLAARLLTIAGPGQIVVSRGTQHLRTRSFEFEDLGDFDVKGKSMPVRAYALKGERPHQAGLEAPSERGLTPLVGRERELGQLRQALRQAVAGQGVVVLMVGDAGVGKSRLLYEFLSGLDRDRIAELDVTCASYGRATPFRPVVELLRTYLSLPEASAAAAVRAVIAERLADLGIEDEERAILLAHLVGVSAPAEFLNRLSGGELRERTFAAVRDVLLGASRLVPLVVLVENVHWLDASSADFVAHVARHLAGHRVLLLLSARPGPLPWSELPGADTVTVSKLGTAEMEAMLRALLGADAVSPQLLQLFSDKAEGNPLYVEEIAHQLRETGSLLVEAGGARLSSVDVKVPPTIHDIIAARVDRLADPQKVTLQGASVVGRRFGISLLSRVVLTAETVAQQLRDLHRLDFVSPSAVDPELMFSFKHALTQDVVYAGLLERRRRSYHAAAGRGLEELYAGHIDEVVELLAHHFGASGDDEKAVDYALLAAAKAQRRWANVEALAYFEGALARLASMPDTDANRIRRIDAVIKQGEVKFALGRHAEHVEALDAIKALVDTVADPPRRATWYYWAGFLDSLVGGRPETSIMYCRKALDIADVSGFDEVRPFAECCLAHVLVAAGDLAAALEVGERALATFEAQGNVWWACRSLWALSPVANYLGDWDRSLAYCHRALEHGQRVNDLRLKVVGWWRTGSMHIQRGDAGAGIRCCEEASALSPIPFDAAMIQAVAGYGRIKAGDVAAGTAEVAAAVAWFERSRLPYTRSLFSLWLVEGHLALGQITEARAVLDPLLDTSVNNGYRHLEGVARRLLGEALGADPAALPHLDRAATILEEIGARNDVAKVLVARAAHHAATGDVAHARESLERARAIFESLRTIDGPRIVDALLASLPDVGRTG
jgi:class 3 adenylate cyclase/tetratricopeptide (TPR) repeat protein